MHGGRRVQDLLIIVGVACPLFDHPDVDLSGGERVCSELQQAVRSSVLSKLCKPLLS